MIQNDYNREYMEGRYSFFEKKIKEVLNNTLGLAFEQIAENIYQRYFNESNNQTNQQPVEYYPNHAISMAIEYQRIQLGVFPIFDKMVSMSQTLMDEITRYMVQNKILGIDPSIDYRAPILYGFFVNIEKFTDSEFYQDYVIKAFQKRISKKGN